MLNYNKKNSHNVVIYQITNSPDFLSNIVPWVVGAWRAMPVFGLPNFQSFCSHYRGMTYHDRIWFTKFSVILFTL